MAFKKVSLQQKRKKSIRKKIFGTPERPRFSVFRSNRYLYAQIIDDVNHKTLASLNSLKMGDKVNKNVAKDLGTKFAEIATEKKIESVVFDRNGYRFHGVIKELADSARAGGLKF